MPAQTVAPDSPFDDATRSAVTAARNATLLASNCAAYTTSTGNCPALNKPASAVALKFVRLPPFPLKLPTNWLLPFVATNAPLNTFDPVNTLLAPSICPGSPATLAASTALVAWSCPLKLLL
ncbi:MAG: hypothetical protein EB082_13555, partial [Verrucomicrobia bacterium]|nr:hypothetical protein [Verrucomicrobiota bacterium]